MIPRIPPAVSGVAAVAAICVVPYYVVYGQMLVALMMLTLAAINAVCARS